MLDDIREKLTRAKGLLREKQRINSSLNEALAILSQEQRKCNQHKAILAKEELDVKALEGLSLTGVFYSLLGTRQDLMESEKQEYLAAKLKFEESVEAVADAQREVNQLREQLEHYQGVQEDYERLVKDKERILAEGGGRQAERLLQLSEQLADLDADRKELQEAVDAGAAAERSLQAVHSELQSAEGWGTWDMLGGGTLATWAKHSKIDSAKAEARTAQRKLQKFRQELADAGQRLHVSLGEIGGFTTFADYFFDGLIADWVVQSKIAEASKACLTAKNRVTAALRECRRRLQETGAAHAQAEQERRSLIEQA